MVAQRLNHLPAMRETWVRSLGPEDPLEKEMATHSSTLAWRIPWRSLVGYSPRGHKELDTTERLNFHFHGGFIRSFLRSLHTVFHHFTFPSAMQDCSLFSTPSPALIVCRLSDDAYSDWCEVLPHRGFDLHFSNND